MSDRLRSRRTGLAAKGGRRFLWGCAVLVGLVLAAGPTLAAYASLEVRAPLRGYDATGGDFAALTFDGTGTRSFGAPTYGYDTPVTVRRDAREDAPPADARRTLLGDATGFTWSLIETRGTPTSPVARGFATEAAATSGGIETTAPGATRVADACQTRGGVLN